MSPVDCANAYKRGVRVASFEVDPDVTKTLSSAISGYEPGAGNVTRQRRDSGGASCESVWTPECATLIWYATARSAVSADASAAPVTRTQAAAQRAAMTPRRGDTNWQ